MALYPELRLLETDEARDAAIKAIQVDFRRTVWRTPKFWMPIVACSLAAVLSAPFIKSMCIRFSASLPLMVLSAALPGVMFGIGFAIAFNYLWRTPMQRALRQYMVGKGIPVCIHCGYDLRGTIEARCPECGTVVTPPASDPAPPAL